MTGRHDVDVLISQLNPVPEPENVVDPDRQVALLRDIVMKPLPRERRRRRTVRRLAVAGTTLALVTALGSAALLAGGERPGAPQRFAVLTALAGELNESGRILHTVERRTVVGSNRAVHEEEKWTLLDDMRYQRFRIGTGRAYEEGAMTPTSSSDYQRRTNTLTVVRYGSRRTDGGPISVERLPVERLARAAAEGRIPVDARVEIDGHRALRIRDGRSVWYVAEDAPMLLRQELELPNGPVQRTDFATFEILPATPENRRLLAIQPPADAERKTVRAPETPRVPALPEMPPAPRR
jgi:hypothetical protein